jgi:hypothetical protein
MPNARQNAEAFIDQAIASTMQVPGTVSNHQLAAALRSVRAAFAAAFAGDTPDIGPAVENPAAEARRSLVEGYSAPQFVDGNGDPIVRSDQPLNPQTGVQLPPDDNGVVAAPKTDMPAGEQPVDEFHDDWETGNAGDPDDIFGDGDAQAASQPVEQTLIRDASATNPVGTPFAGPSTQPVAGAPPNDQSNAAAPVMSKAVQPAMTVDNEQPLPNDVSRPTNSVA